MNKFLDYNNFPLPIFGYQELLDLHKIGFPPQYLGTALLGATAGAMGMNWKLRIRGSQITANLYCCNVGYSGSFKSPSTDIFSAVLERKQADITAAYARDLELNPDAKDTNSFLFKGGTQEGLAKVISQNPHGIVLKYDEFSSMFKGMDMYKKKGGNDLEFFIQMFDGQYSPPALKVAPTYAIPYGTTMTMFGNTTFDSLKVSFDAEKDDGLKERMLWAVYRSREHKDIPFDYYKVGKWEDRIFQILSSRHNPCYVDFPPEFEQKFLDWKRHKVDVAGLSNYLAKCHKFFFKFCLILACLFDYQKVTAEIVDGAILLLEYYADSFVKLFGMEKDDPLTKVSSKLQEAYNLLPDEFQAGKAYQVIKHLISERTFFDFLKNAKLFEKVDGKRTSPYRKVKISNLEII